MPPIEVLGKVREVLPSFRAHKAVEMMQALEKVFIRKERLYYNVTMSERGQ